MHACIARVWVCLFQNVIRFQWKYGCCLFIDFMTRFVALHDSFFSILFYNLRHFLFCFICNFVCLFVLFCGCRCKISDFCAQMERHLIRRHKLVLILAMWIVNKPRYSMAVIISISIASIRALTHLNVQHHQPPKTNQHSICSEPNQVSFQMVHAILS